MSGPHHATGTGLEERLRRAAGAKRFRVVLPEGGDERVLTAAVALARLGFVRPVVLGEPMAVQALAGGLGLALDGVEVLDPEAPGPLDRLAAAQARRRPDTAEAVARRMARKPLFHAGMMLAEGEADAMVAGATCTTARVLEAAMLTIGLADGVGTASSCFLMSVPASPGGSARTLVFADCAVNVQPDAEALADIGIASAESLRVLVGEEPAVAFLSFSTHGSARHAAAERIRAAAGIARQRRPDLAIDGELQVDAALSPRAAALKLGDPGPVAGRANVLVFPDLDAANIGYKLVQYLAGAEAHGPLLQGFARPVADLSRGASVRDIVQTALLTLCRVVSP